MTEPFPLPRHLARAAADHGLEEWVAALPATVAALAERWSLEVGPPFQPGGVTAWVAPARTSTGEEAVLKVGLRHDEARDEAEGLRAWDGQGTVRLLAAEDLSGSTTALLLECCRPGHALADEPVEAQDVVLGLLLPRLWRDPPPGSSFRPLQDLCDRWADECEAELADHPVRLDAGMIQEGLALFRSLPASAERQALLGTDLHAGNVLSAGREPWLVIDPKPYVGDPTYDALQHLLNGGAVLAADPLGRVRRLAGLLGLDPRRLARWLFARCVVEAPGWPELVPVARRLAPHAAG